MGLCECAEGFGGDRRCSEHAAGLAGFLQMKPKAKEVRSAAVEQGGGRASFPVLRRSSRRRRGGTAMAEASGQPRRLLQ